MKRILMSVMAVLAAGTLSAETFFALEAVPETLRANVAPGREIELKLEENARAGYVWTAGFDARLGLVSIEHKRPRHRAAGASGYAKIEIEPDSAAPFEVTLKYVDSTDPEAAPAKVLTVYVNGSDGREAPEAPQQAAASGEPVDETVPLLIDDRSYRFEDIPAAVQVTLSAGRDIDFELEEKPGEKLTWRIAGYDGRVCRVELEHDAGDAFEYPEAEIEIEAIAPGSTVVEFIAGTGADAKSFRCFVTVK